MRPDAAPLRLACAAIHLLAALFLPLQALAGGSAAPDLRAAPLFDGMGNYRLAGAGTSLVARRYVDQGMVLAFGFNAAEAARSFEAAVRIEPRCAACWWALAWALGPTINADMQPADTPRVTRALARARALAPAAAARHRGLITALSARHPERRDVDDATYARRMRRLASQHAHDADIATLAAEALLNLHPYDWWRKDGTPQPWTPEIEALLARALAIDPAHPGANHYAIHLYESSARPGRALASAQRLETLVPGSGHLLHMPAHIYMRVGRYAEASAANRRSIAADARYLAQVDAQGAYRVGYVAHNHHFLWASAAMQGRSAEAIAAARTAWPVACGPRPGDRSTALLQHYSVLPLFALVRFGRWEALLTDAPPPETSEPYPTAIWHYARGTALLRTGRTREARDELDRLEQAAVDPRLGKLKVKNINAAATLVRIARLTLQADLALAAGRAQSAVSLLRQATALEDGLEYDEPHLWLAPTRHALGAALLAAGRPADAERVYREDLAHYPDNGWALAGLARALREQRRELEAAEVDARQREAWRDADIVIDGSRL
jgi:tetratricopeptide (TPR) repeat protein